MVGLDDVFVLPPDVACQDVDGEMVVVLPRQGTFLVLNETASWLIAHFDGRHSLRELVFALAGRYGLPAQQVTEDTRRWLQALVDGGVRIESRNGNHFAAGQDDEPGLAP